MADTAEYITVTCENCGKKYRIDQSKIKNDQAKAKCKSCGHMFVISKPAKQEEEEIPWAGDFVVDEPQASEAAAAPASGPSTDRGSTSESAGLSKKEAKAERKQRDKKDKTKKEKKTKQDKPKKEKKAKQDKPKKEKKAKAKKEKPSGAPRGVVGLTVKFMFFTLLPILIISTVSIYFSINNMLRFQNLSVKESTAVVKDVSEDMIGQISTAVARQTRQYLFSHPDLRKQEFNTNLYFKKVALQNIGETGYTALYELPGPEGQWRVWAHYNPDLVGEDLQELKQDLGPHFRDFWKIVTGVENGGKASGYYKWPAENGKGFVDKFMVCTPVDGTPFIIMASLNVEEFTAPLERIENRGRQLANSMLTTNGIILGVGLFIGALIIAWYGRNVTLRVRYLAGKADSISLGNLEEEIEIKSGDEIGELGESISRMQESIRLAMQRLRRRR